MAESGRWQRVVDGRGVDGREGSMAERSRWQRVVDGKVVDGRMVDGREG